MQRDEIRVQLEQNILPFWMKLKDDTYGGFYGGMDGGIGKRNRKGCRDGQPLSI